jgi:hypothetical protein
MTSIKCTKFTQIGIFIIAGITNQFPEHDFRFLWSSFRWSCSNDLVCNRKITYVMYDATIWCPKSKMSKEVRLDNGSTFSSLQIEFRHFVFRHFGLRQKSMDLHNVRSLFLCSRQPNQNMKYVIVEKFGPKFGFYYRLSHSSFVWVGCQSDWQHS